MLREGKPQPSLKALAEDEQIRKAALGNSPERPDFYSRMHSPAGSWLIVIPSISYGAQRGVWPKQESFWY